MNVKLTVQGCLAQPIEGHPALGSTSAAGRAQPADAHASLGKAGCPPAASSACMDNLIQC